MRFRNVIAAAVTIMVTGGASAQTPPADAVNESFLHYILGIGIEHTDNVFLTTNNKVADDILKPRIDFDYNRTGSRLDVRAAGTLERFEYLGGSFGGYSRNGLAGIANLHILPERLDWVAADFLGVVPVNTQSTNTPNNLEEANVFVTGPTLRARFGARLKAELDVRYANSYATKSDEFNGDRLAAAGRLLYILSPRNSVGLELATQQARYDNIPANREYDRDDAFVSWNFTGSRTRLTADVGYTWLEFLGNGPRRGANFMRIRAGYDITPRASVTLELERDFTDAAQSMQLTTEQIGTVPTINGLSRISATPDIFYQKFAGLDFRYAGDVWDLKFEPYFRQIRYVSLNPLDFDQDDRGLLVRVSYRLTPLLTLAGQTRIEQRDYTTVDRRDTDREYSAWLMWQFTKRWAWRFEASSLQRETEAIDLSYRENIVGMNLIYAQ
ncbi:MAG: hypothetical protein ABI451_04130 [Dokdonella sp.]